MRKNLAFLAGLGLATAALQGCSCTPGNQDTDSGLVDTGDSVDTDDTVDTDTGMETGDTDTGERKDLECELSLEDLRDGGSNAVQVVLDKSAGWPDEFNVDMSYMGRIISRQMELETDAESVLLGPLPYVIEGNMIQEAILAAGGSLEVSIHVEALQGGEEKCSASLSVPFSEWNTDWNEYKLVDFQVSEGFSADEFLSSAADTLFLQTVSAEDAYNDWNYVLMEDVLGNIYGVYRLPYDVADELVDRDNATSSSISGASAVDGNIYLMTDATLHMHSALILNYDQFTAEIADSHDTFSDSYSDDEAEVWFHNKFSLGEDGRFQALDWVLHQANEGSDYHTALVSFGLDENMNLVDVEEKFDSFYCSNEALYNYGNATGPGPIGYYGSRFQGTTFAVDRSNAVDDPEDIEANSEYKKGYFYADELRGDRSFIFVRAGYKDEALTDGCWDEDPNVQVVELSDPFGEGSSPFDFIHDGKVRQTGERTYEVSTLNLGVQTRPTFVSIYTFEVPEDSIPTESVMADLVCASESERNTAAHGNIYYLPNDEFAENPFIGVFPGKTNEHIYFYSPEAVADGSGECVQSAYQEIDVAVGSGGADVVSPNKWVEPLNVNRFNVDGVKSQTLFYDTDALQGYIGELGQ
jgi:hypothetical protein